MKPPYRIGCVFLLALTPSICPAIGDGADAAALFEVLIKFELVWTPLALVVFLLLLLRKMSMPRRIVYCLVFWCGQIFVPWILPFAYDLYGTVGQKDIEQTTKPVVLAGVAFPAGSRAEYTHIGRGFWRRKLTGVESKEPVKLGSIAITGLSVDGLDDDYVDVRLARIETIDGWSCSKTAGISLNSGTSRLIGCPMASSQEIGGLVWRAGTDVEMAIPSGWTLKWYASDGRDSPNAPAQAFGLPVQSMNATYSDERELIAWTGSPPDAGVTIGDYRFSDATMTWRAPDRIVIAGYGKQQKTGAEVTCVQWQPQERSAGPCVEASEPQQGQRPEESPDSSRADDE
jgi:hypothetical protein